MSPGGVAVVGVVGVEPFDPPHPASASPRISSAANPLLRNCRQCVSHEPLRAAAYTKKGGDRAGHRLRIPAVARLAYAASSTGSGSRTLATFRSRTMPTALQELQRDPGDVELVPGQAVTGRDGMRVVIVVPAFAEGEQRDPPAVARIIARREPARCPTCASPNSPATSRAGRRPHAGRSPHRHQGQPADREQQQPQHGERHPVVVVQPA